MTVAVAVALGVCGRPASAAPAAGSPGEHALELSSEAPRDCGDAASVRREVDLVVGKTGEVHRKVRAHGEVRRTEGAWSVETGGSGGPEDPDFGGMGDPDFVNVVPPVST